MRIKAEIAYDGTAYYGWQVQKQYPTIQLHLERALTHICGANVAVTGAGRTDSGVHALRQIAHFDWQHSLRIDKLRLALNSLLPPDIRVRRLEETSPDFHARFDAQAKTYLYRIDRAFVYHPLNYRFALHYPFPMQLERLDDCAATLTGQHDFLAFQGSGTDVVTTTRTVLDARIDHEPTDNNVFGEGVLNIRITATGFLRKMMRFVVGTMIEIASGRRDAQDFSLALQTGERKYVGVPAPARGLFLEYVRYRL